MMLCVAGYWYFYLYCAASVIIMLLIHPPLKSIMLRFYISLIQLKKEVYEDVHFILHIHTYNITKPYNHQQDIRIYAVCHIR